MDACGGVQAEGVAESGFGVVAQEFVILFGANLLLFISN